MDTTGRRGIVLRYLESTFELAPNLDLFSPPFRAVSFDSARLFNFAVGRRRRRRRHGSYVVRIWVLSGITLIEHYTTPVFPITNPALQLGK